MYSGAGNNTYVTTTAYTGVCVGHGYPLGGGGKFAIAYY